MPKQLLLGAFEELTPNFISNAWHHERGDTSDFASLEFWQNMARQLDQAGFDFLFFAEALGYPMTSEGVVPEVVIREAVQFPVHDPLMIVSGLAATVDRLGFVVTASTTSQHPYLNARSFATLDHLSRGRIGWNIVTSDQQNALVRLLGQSSITPHDKRYERAREFVDLNLRLWEGAWEDGAVVADKARKVFAEPEKVHRIQHVGEHFRFDGYFAATPSVQRTPTLLQAGTSPAGKDFAAGYAECVFVQERELDRLKATVQDIRDRAVANGRPADSIKIVNSVSIIVAETAEKAEALRHELNTTPTRAAAAALFMGWSGVDLGSLDPDSTLDEVATEVGQTMVNLWRSPDGVSPTVGAVLDSLPSTIGGVKVTGTAEHVAAELERIAAETDIDGYLVESTYGGMDSYREFIDQVMPILRERGVIPTVGRRGSLREMLTGATSARLPETHPGARYRAGSAE